MKVQDVKRPDVAGMKKMAHKPADVNSPAKPAVRTR
jgi:hypothetical protein